MVTNPPFSLFREFLDQLIEYKKDFIILGSLSSTTYKKTFSLFKENKIRVGNSIHGQSVYFKVPKEYPLIAKGYYEKDGEKFIRVAAVRWISNIQTPIKRPLMLTKTYNETDYPKLDGVDAINVNKVADIPMDYDGVMGVPITFLDRFDKTQFKLLECFVPKLNGKQLYKRIFIQRVESNNLLEDSKNILPFKF